MGTITDRSTPIFYLPDGMTFSIIQTASGLSIPRGVIRTSIYNANRKQIDRAKFQLEPTRTELDMLDTLLQRRCIAFEADEPALTLLPFVLDEMGGD